MIKILHSYGLPAAMAVLIGLSSYNFQEKGRLNDAENSGNQVKTAVNSPVVIDVHTGNTDRSNHHIEK